jgi:predicted Mrr-cat superfamily restriction endonuclease
VFLVNGQVQGDEVGVVTMEQVATQVAQAEATYNSNDDLEEMTNMLIDL